jgi:FSR family fosmidomycin resistance protein-like MFS transporter
VKSEEKHVYSDGQRVSKLAGALRVRALVSVSFMHFLNDLHPTLLPTFLPVIVGKLSLSLGQAGFLSTAFGIVNLMVQPLAGYLADKRDKPTFALWAPFFTAAGACLLPIAPNYGVSLLFVAIMGFGTAGFHPQGHGITGLAGGSGKLGAYLAIFGFAGTFGAAVSPLYGVFLLRTAGPNLVPLALIPVFVSILAARCFLPAKSLIGNPQASRQQVSENFWRSTGRVLGICLPLVIISIVRDATSQGIRVFLPILVTSRGGSLESGGAVLFAFTVAGSAANLAGGKLADMFGKERIITIMLVLSPIFLFPAVLMDGMASVALFVLGGACIAATNPVTLAMAQEYVPENRSSASSLVMGVSWGFANIVASPIGVLADYIGLTGALALLALSPLTVVAYLILNKFFRGRLL